MIYNHILLFTIGLIVIYYSAESLISSSTSLAAKFNISKVLIGVGVVAVGTSLPEFVVSIIAILKKEQGLLIGNVLGSNIANIGLVFGFSLLVSSVKASFKKIKFEIIILFIVSFILFVGVFFHILSFKFGLIFIFIFIYFIYSLLNKEHPNQDLNSFEKDSSQNKIIFLLLIGLLGLPLGSEIFIRGAIGIAKFFEVPSHIVGLSSVAIGTSVPELAAGIIAARKKEFQIIIGNVLGSNIFNIIFVIGFSLIFTNIETSSLVGIRSNVAVFFIFSIFFCMVLMLRIIPRFVGLVLLGAYGLFIVYIF